MVAMSGVFDLRSRVGWLHLIGLLEAVSWVGLLLGMYFKYLGSPRTEIGVKIFGPLHGGVFLAFLVAAVLAGSALKWSIGTWLLAGLASIVPLGTVIFLIWVDRTGRTGAVDAVSITSRPGRPAPETT
jgi:integral membrane protein